jgi:hypothetical protein
MILHVPRYVERRIRHSVDAHFDVALLNIGDGVLCRLRHLQLHHHDGKSPTGKRSNINLLAGGQPLPAIAQGHLEELVDELF